jgi:Na+/phosphate symporter
MIIYLPLFVALVGVLIYAFAVNPKLSEVGRIMFAFGLLVTLRNIPHMVSVLR